MSNTTSDRPIDAKPDRALDAKQASQKTGYSIPSMYRKAADGTFPKPIKLGANKSAWLESGLDEWLRTRPVATLRRKPAAPKKDGAPQNRNIAA